MSIVRPIVRDIRRNIIRPIIATSLPVPLCFMPLSDDLLLSPGVGAATFTRSTTGTFIDKSTGLVTTAAIDEPRFEANGVLIEGASENLLLRSEEFDNVLWVPASGAFVTANTAVAPDGTMTADTIDLSSGGAARVSMIVSGLNASTYAYSIYLKALPSESGLFPIAFRDGDDTNGSSKASKLVSLTDSAWVRVDIQATGSATVDDFIYPGNRRDVGGETLFKALVWGAQLEELPFASSYMPTTTTTVTRTADNLSIDAANIPAPTEDYSVSAVVDLLGINAGTTQAIWGVDGESTRQTVASISSSPGVLRFRHSANSDGVSPSTTQKISSTVSSGTMSLYQSGALVSSNTTGAVTGTNTSVIIGNGAFGDHLYGHIKSFRIDEVALTAAQVSLL